MILFTILAIIFVILAALLILTVSTVGAAGIAIFGDVIVCMVIIGFIMRAIIRKKRNKDDY